MNYQAQFGGQVGAFVRINISELFSMQSGLTYSYQGVGFVDSLQAPPFQMHYLKIPILANLTFDQKVRVGLGLEAGVMVESNTVPFFLNNFSLGVRLEVA